MEVRSDYSCKDCYFFDEEKCKECDEYRETTAGNVACRAFEYRKIIV